MAHILIVDDNPLDARLIAGLLEPRGHRCSVHPEGRDIVARLAEIEPDLVIMDVMMEGVDGFSACRQIRQSPATKGVPVVMVSARTSENDQFWAQRNGASGYVCKPVRPEDLYAAIDAALATGERAAGPERPWRSWSMMRAAEGEPPPPRSTVRAGRGAVQQEDRRSASEKHRGRVPAGAASTAERLPRHLRQLGERLKTPRVG